MDILYERCCGIDVHKKVVVATYRQGRNVETRHFGTYTDELKEMVAWLKEHGCQAVAMESTGVYWKPLYNLFEAEGLEAIVVNAQHMKAVPGRKTDVKDSEWIADLLQHGLLKASYIPGREQRDLRDLTRYRKSRIEERARELNRLQKILEGANIKVGNVLSEIEGASSQRFLKLVVSEQELTIEAVAERRHRNMKSSTEEIHRSLQGVLSSLQKELITAILDIISEQSEQIKRIDLLIDKHMSEIYRKASEALMVLPGIAKVSSDQIIAEVGVDMGRFPTANHFCSWAGICPGNNESAGKRRSGRTNKANKILKSTLVQCARSAVKHRDSFLYAQYQRLVVRRGDKKAIVAVAHSMLIAIYHMLSGEEYKDLGSDYYNAFNKEKKINSHLKQLQALGWEPPAPVALS